jgi:hypothetical protein
MSSANTLSKGRVANIIAIIKCLVLILSLFTLNTNPLFLYTKMAQTFAIRFTVHHKPQLYTGILRPYRGSSYNSCCSFVRGGDCEAIEQYVFALFAECRCKDIKYLRIMKEKVEKDLSIVDYLSFQRNDIPQY